MSNSLLVAAGGWRNNVYINAGGRCVNWRKVYGASLGELHHRRRENNVSGHGLTFRFKGRFFASVSCCCSRSSSSWMMSGK